MPSHTAAGEHGLALPMRHGNSCPGSLTRAEAAIALFLTKAACLGPAVPDLPTSALRSSEVMPASELPLTPSGLALLQDSEEKAQSFEQTSQGVESSAQEIQEVEPGLLVMTHLLIVTLHCPPSNGVKQSP